VIAERSYQLVQRLLGGEEFHQTRKGACVAPQDTEAYKKGKNLSLLLHSADKLQNCFEFQQDKSRSLNVSFLSCSFPLHIRLEPRLNLNVPFAPKSAFSAAVDQAELP